MKSRLSSELDESLSLKQLTNYGKYLLLKLFHSPPTKQADLHMTEPTQQTNSQPQLTLPVADESASKDFTLPKSVQPESD
jgi:hypothetical protein